MMSRNGEIEINVMHEKIRFLKMKLSEKKREIELALKTLPLKKSLDADLVVLQIQVGAIKKFPPIVASLLAKQMKVMTVEVWKSLCAFHIWHIELSGMMGFLFMLKAGAGFHQGPWLLKN